MEPPTMRRAHSIAPALARSRTPSAAIFALALLLSSTLLFFVQPLFAKMVLPRLGGTPSVWNTCMVFFQASLLAGYAYAHGMSRWLAPRQQLIVHALVLALPTLALPLALPSGWTPPPEASPLPSLLGLLTSVVGLPFFAVATTAPLLSCWFSTTDHPDAADPYFLYAASNLGSMVALLGYPLVAEPLLSVGGQAQLWTYGYVVFASLTLLCGVRALALTPAPDANRKVEPRAPTVSWATRLRWIALSAVPSSYLLGVTTYVTTDVAAVPLLWVLPLVAYLLTFILVFAKRPPLAHTTMVHALPLAVLGPTLLLCVRSALPVWVPVGLHLTGFFVAAMVCHGELSRTRPTAAQLTEFYLMLSIGGVLGGAFNALLAPSWFTRPLEYPLAIVLACLLCPARTPRSTPARPRERVLDLVLPMLAGLLAWSLGALLAWQELGPKVRALALALPLVWVLSFVARRLRFSLGVAALLAFGSFFPPDGATVLAMERSFFGVHRVLRAASGRFHDLHHGTTLHGRQRIDADDRPSAADEPLSYYHRAGPLGGALSSLAPEARRRVSVIGLGTGSIAAYAGAGDAYTFYEIDPVVRDFADRSPYFDFLAAARQRGAAVEVVLGDARLTLARAQAASSDVLILDAFSGDAIPSHLLTREALAMYVDKLSPEGLLLAHVSNIYLDLVPVLARLADDAGLIVLLRDDSTLRAQEIADGGRAGSEWMLLARRSRDLASLRAAGFREVTPPRSARVWTDDFSNIVTTLR